jgi:hypothetical protein
MTGRTLLFKCSAVISDVDGTLAPSSLPGMRDKSRNLWRTERRGTRTWEAALGIAREQ